MALSESWDQWLILPHQPQSVSRRWYSVLSYGHTKTLPTWSEWGLYSLRQSQMMPLTSQHALGPHLQ